MAVVPPPPPRVVAVPCSGKAAIRSFHDVTVRLAATLAVVLFAVFVGGCAGDDPKEIETQRVVAQEMHFSPKEMSVNAGAVTFHVVNRGKLTHTFSVGPNADEVEVNPGKSQDFTLTLEPGTYKYVCRIINHEGLGMHGVLEVRP